MTTDGTTFYPRQFYENRHEATRDAAEKLLMRVAEVIPPIRSAVDVGCGVGTWLSVLQARGVECIHGHDGDWVDPALLEIPEHCFTSHDLTKPIPAPDPRYDLAISLEVAEHLPASAAPTFVQSLTDQSDFILFSAAIPHQGGHHHVNEQWLEYWNELFHECDYVGIDALRHELWHDADIQTWYRQNTVLFVRQTRLDDLQIDITCTVSPPVSMVHPAAYERKITDYERRIEQMQTLKGAWKLFRRAISARVMQRQLDHSSKQSP